MVNVFVNTTLDQSIIECVNNLLYVLTEQNITSIDKCNLVNSTTYNQMTEQYLQLINMINDL